MRIMMAATYVDVHAYICFSKACRSRASLNKKRKWPSTLNIEFVKILRGMYS